MDIIFEYGLQKEKWIVTNPTSSFFADKVSLGFSQPNPVNLGQFGFSVKVEITSGDSFICVCSKTYLVHIKANEIPDEVTIFNMIDKSIHLVAQEVYKANLPYKIVRQRLDYFRSDIQKCVDLWSLTLRQSTMN